MLRTVTDRSSHSTTNSPIPLTSGRRKLGALYDFEKPTVLTLPIYSRLLVVNGWRAARIEKDGMKYIHLALKRQDGISYYPAHEVRKDLLGLRTVKAAVAFCSRYGKLDGSTTRQVDYSLLQIRTLKAETLKMMKLSQEKFFSREPRDVHHFFNALPPAAQLLLAKVPSLVLEASDVWNAVRYATYLDQLAGIRAGSCPQCGEAFWWGPQDKKRTYCKTACQQSASKDRFNEKHKKGKYAKAAK